MMHKLTRGTPVMALLLMTLCSLVDATEKPWTVRDSIEMTYYVSDSAYRFIDGVEITPSMDGKQFFFITMRGDLDNDLMLYELQVYGAADVSRALRTNGVAPAPVATHSVKTRIPEGVETIGIRNPKWTHDGGAIYFIEIDANARSVLKRLDVASGAVKSVTDESKYVDEYHLEHGYILFREKVSEKTLWEESDLPSPLAHVDEEFFQRALSWRIPRYASYVVDRDQVVRRFGHIESRHMRRTLGSVSPDGKWIIAAKSLDSSERPTFWTEYAINNRDGSTQLYLFDMSELNGRPILNAPIGIAISNWTPIETLWFPDSSKVILVNTMLPIDAKIPSHRDTTYIVEYDIDSASMRTIAPLPGPTPDSVYPPIGKVSWHQPGRELLLEYRDGATMRRTSYVRQKNGWVTRELESTRIDEQARATEKPRQLCCGLNVQIRQSLNEPPHVVASLGRKDLRLTPEDPVVAKAKLLPVEKIEWKDSRGKPWKGALLVPSGAHAPKLPLVIQFGEHASELFSADGVLLKPGHSAQAFAARGYVVLTVGDSRESDLRTGTVDELPDFRDATDAAVNMLDQRGLIDLSRVALIGHSRMGFRSFYIATHPKGFTPATIVVQDSFTGGFSEYVLGQSLFPNPLGFESLYSRERRPFWMNKSAWTDNAPSFSLENLTSPLLLTHLSENAKGPPVLGMTAFMETYGGLRRLGRPLEAIAFPGASHNPIQPKQRAANMQLVIDWVEFWLSGREDSDPLKAEQYERWRKLWKQQEAVIAEQRAAGKVVAMLQPLESAKSCGSER